MAMSFRPFQRRFPTAASQSMTPTEKTSARRSTRSRARLLGRHVRDLALEHAGARLERRVHRLRDAEVDDLHLAVVGDEDVVRGHVAVDDAERRPS